MIIKTFGLLFLIDLIDFVSERDDEMRRDRELKQKMTETQTGSIYHELNLNPIVWTFLLYLRCEV